MKGNKFAVIGGTGVYNLESAQNIKWHELQTPYGTPSEKIAEIFIEDHSFYFIPRHGIGHKFNPSEVNYRANIYALKMLGARHILSISAVGSLKEQLSPGSFFLPDQYIDWTKGKRARTFFENGIVGHVSTADPIYKPFQKICFDYLSKFAKTEVHQNGSYLCIEGPQFSSKAESHIYRSFNASVIGMTNVPESYLASEAGMSYATIALVTDYDCWKEEHCTVEEIMKVMKKNNLNIQMVLPGLLTHLNKFPFEFSPQNSSSVMTHLDKMTDKNKEIMSVLLS